MKENRFYIYIVHFLYTWEQGNTIGKIIYTKYDKMVELNEDTITNYIINKIETDREKKTPNKS